MIRMVMMVLARYRHFPEACFGLHFARGLGGPMYFYSFQRRSFTLAALLLVMVSRNDPIQYLGSCIVRAIKSVFYPACEVVLYIYLIFPAISSMITSRPHLGV
ncbi:hypothetical protein M413DRAFT_239186 [Hebeloma cylindrosporum]|uniref:Uncharacterized protein n=1 Tax=Hebeloma cylindrosporum TaxID=76867 RepID=A0A0C3C3Q6_HEBCY|nr:hypothetical protein M413DRAFT_239186 [Hebeloma cylindrosporum h7]